MNGRRSEIVRGNQRWEPVSIARNLPSTTSEMLASWCHRGVTHTMARIHAGVVFSDGNMHQGRVWASSKGAVDVLVAGMCVGLLKVDSKGFSGPSTVHGRGGDHHGHASTQAVPPT